MQITLHFGLPVGNQPCEHIATRFSGREHLAGNIGVTGVVEGVTAIGPAHRDWSDIEVVFPGPHGLPAVDPNHLVSCHALERSGVALV